MLVIYSYDLLFKNVNVTIASPINRAFLPLRNKMLHEYFRNGHYKYNRLKNVLCMPNTFNFEETFR